MKKYMVLAILALASFNVSAQAGSSEFGVNYHISLPTGEFGDFIQDNSYRGFSLDYRYFVQEKFAVGLNVGWEVYHKKFDRTTYQFDNGAATLVHWRFGHHVPILITGHYSFVDGGKIKLNGGLGLGPAFVREEVWVGVYEFEFTQWGFELAPELELQFKLTDSFGLLFAPRYQVVFNGEQANFRDEKNHWQAWDFRFGLYFKM